MGTYRFDMKSHLREAINNPDIYVHNVHNGESNKGITLYYYILGPKLIISHIIDG